MDFGLARLQTSDEKLTQGDDILGTPAYMSPEQAQGDKDESEESSQSTGVTAAGDQYSLGVTLYEMLCGELPFNGPPEIVIFNVIQTEPPAPRSISADIPRDLKTICQIAMSKEPARRYTDCVEMAQNGIEPRASLSRRSSCCAAVAAIHVSCSGPSASCNSLAVANRASGDLERHRWQMSFRESEISGRDWLGGQTVCAETTLARTSAMRFPS